MDSDALDAANLWGRKEEDDIIRANNVAMLDHIDAVEAENAALKEQLAEATSELREAADLVDPRVKEKFAALKAECEMLKAEKEQWEPEWKSQAEANAAGYNQAHAEITSLRSRVEELRDALSACAPSWLPEAVRDKRRNALAALDKKG
jgi:chromosome segregation ATPase